MRTWQGLTVALTAIAIGVGAAPAAAFDGTNPFRCELQQAGLGATVPDPGADPYCVEFDKTQQNVTEGGLLTFLALEPARVSAALPKCFYFQRDHWRGSVVQEDGRTETYAWDGSYFFDKARGAGGAFLTGTRAGGRPVGDGGGGVDVRLPADPRCAERAAREAASIYATPPGSAGRGLAVDLAVLRIRLRLG